MDIKNLDKEFLKRKLSLLKNSDTLLQQRREKEKKLDTLFRETKEFTLIKKEILELDHTLDLLTDDNEINKKEILTEINQEILALFPESHLSYQYIEKKKKQQTLTKKELSTLEPYITKYHTYFRDASLLLIKGKERSLFSILFGRHPKVLLSYEITKLAKEATQDIKQVESLSFVCVDKKIQEELLQLLKELMEEVNKKWNAHLYEQAFHLFATRISTLHEKLTTLSEENGTLSIELESKMIEWSEYYLHMN